MPTFQSGRSCLTTLSLMLLLLGASTSGMEMSRRSRRSSGSVETDPSLTSYDDDCPNGLIAYEKFNRETGVFDCAIRTAEICHALCSMVYSNNWDISNPLPLRDTVDRDKWYCRSLPGYPTRPCYFKPKADIEEDVRIMYSNS